MIQEIIKILNIDENITEEKWLNISKKVNETNNSVTVVDLISQTREFIETKNQKIDHLHKKIKGLSFNLKKYKEKCNFISSMGKVKKVKSDSNNSDSDNSEIIVRDNQQYEE